MPRSAGRPSSLSKTRGRRKKTDNSSFDGGSLPSQPSQFGAPNWTTASFKNLNVDRHAVHNSLQSAILRERMFAFNRVNFGREPAVPSVSAPIWGTIGMQRAQTAPETSRGSGVNFDTLPKEDFTAKEWELQAPIYELGQRSALAFKQGGSDVKSLAPAYFRRLVSE